MNLFGVFVIQAYRNRENSDILRILCPVDVLGTNQASGSVRIALHLPAWNHV